MKKRVLAQLIIAASFLLSMAHPLMAMSESPEQLFSRVSRYVICQEPYLMTAEDAMALQALSSEQTYAQEIRDLFAKNQKNFNRYSLTTEQAQYIEGLLSEAQSVDDLLFDQVPGQSDLWELFMHVEKFFRGDAAIEAVQFFKRWQERYELMSQQ